jgi:hypothetical protein
MALFYSFGEMEDRLGIQLQWETLMLSESGLSRRYLDENCISSLISSSHLAHKCSGGTLYLSIDIFDEMKPVNRFWAL